ncbi:MAG: hypothetical protein KDB86_10575 [Actinobacteria bacterium]|nr:hypothetical protein [Actinomycetota bacterium]MCB9388222.1 hypothetical protein [Acidimicrobiia bacterium]
MTTAAIIALLIIFVGLAALFAQISRQGVGLLAERTEQPTADAPEGTATRHPVGSVSISLGFFTVKLENRSQADIVQIILLVGMAAAGFGIFQLAKSAGGDDTAASEKVSLDPGATEVSPADIPRSHATSGSSVAPVSPTASAASTASVTVSTFMQLRCQTSEDAARWEQAWIDREDALGLYGHSWKDANGNCTHDEYETATASKPADPPPLEMQFCTVGAIGLPDEMKVVAPSCPGSLAP